MGIRSWVVRLAAFALVVGYAWAAPAITLSPEAASGLAWLKAQATADGSLAGEGGSMAYPLQAEQETATTLAALEETVPAALASHAAADPADDTEALARKALALLAAGQDASAATAQLLARQNTDGGFGPATGYTSQALATAHALWALGLAGQTDSAAGSQGRAWLMQQIDANGRPRAASDWLALETGAVALRALALASNDFTAQQAASRLAAYLRGAQGLDGGWLGDPYLTAWVTEALNTLGADAQANQIAGQFLLASQGADGSWLADPFLTAVVLRALSLKAQIQQPGTDPTLGSLSGRVVNAATGWPVAGATVAAGPGLAAVSDSDGRFSLANLTAGTLNLTITRTGYQTGQATASLVAGAAIDLGAIPLAADPAAAMVSGALTQTAGGAPLAGATLTVTGSSTWTAISDADGRYEIAGIPPGAVALTAELPGYHTVTLQATLAPGGTLIFSPSLAPSTGPAPSGDGQAAGLVLDAATSDALAGAAILIDGQQAAASGNDGRFSIPLAGGVHELRAAMAGYRDVSVSFLLASGAHTDLGRIALQAQAQSTTLRGTVTDRASGKPLAGAVVDLPGTFATANADASGAYTLGGLSGTAFDLRVSATGYLTQTFHLDVAAPGVYRLDATLEAATSISLDLAPFTVAPNPAGAQADLAAATVLHNAGAATVAGVVRVLIYDNGNNLIAEGSAIDPATGDLLGQVEVAPGADVPASLTWNSGQFKAGAYRMVARVIQAGSANASTPLGIALTERAAPFGLVSSQGLEGSIAADPPVLRAGTQTVVHLKAAVRNAGNQALPAGDYQLRITNSADGSEAYRQSVSGPDLAVMGIADLAFPDWTPAAAGDYALSITRPDIPQAGAVTGSVYVGDAATAAYRLDKTVVGPGTQAIGAHFHVEGRDMAQGSVGNPLDPLIRTAIQKAVTYNDAKAVQWTANNQCLGCHTQAQALVGGVFNEHLATYDAGKRRALLNMLMGNIQTNGNITTGNIWGNLITQTSFGVWALTAWEGIKDHAGSFYRAVDLLLQKQSSQGYWQADACNGWICSTVDTTGANVASLSKAVSIYEQADTASLGQYSLSPRFSIGNKDIFGLVRDAQGNALIADGRAGTVIRISPDGSRTVLMSGLTWPLDLLMEPDGSLLIATQYGLIRRLPDGSRVTVSKLLGTNIARANDGTIYYLDRYIAKIYKVSTSGNVSLYLQGAPLENPTAIAVDPEGRLLVASGKQGRVIRFASQSDYDYPYSVASNWYISDIGFVDGVLWAATSSGFVRYDQNGIVDVVAPLASKDLLDVGAFTQNADGSVWVLNWGAGAIYELLPTALDRAAVLERLTTSVRKGADWLVAQPSSNPKNIELAQQLIGLGEAEKLFQGQPQAAMYRQKMEELAGVLRGRQNADGSWSRATAYTEGDALMTAMVGYALDYLDPPADDPAIDKAIRWVLGQQLADGSWTSANGVFTTHLSASTWVAIWLPVALERIGGVDTDLNLSLPANVALSQPEPAPNSVTDTADGGKHYVWNLVGVTSKGRDIDFTLSFADLLPNETRPAGTDAHLTVTNSFTQQPASLPIAIPGVTVATGLNLSVATDKSGYGAHEALQGLATVANAGAGASDGSVHLSVLDAGGALVADLGTIPYAGLPSGQNTVLTADWNTGTTVPGNYRLAAELLDANGNGVATGEAPFTIRTDAGGSSPVTASLATDKQDYAPTAVVHITGRVANQVANAAAQGLVLSETVTDPTGQAVDLGSRNLPDLQPGALRDEAFPYTLKQAPAGTYTVTQTLADRSGLVLDTRQASFTVHATAETGEGLSGTLTTAPEIHQGETLTLYAGAQNLGNTDLSGVPARIAIVDPVAGGIVAEYPASLDLAKGQQNLWNAAWIAEGVVDRGYAAALIATVGGRDVTLAQAGFILRAPPIKLDASFKARPLARLLVLAACQPGESESHGGGSESHGGGSQGQSGSCSQNARKGSGSNTGSQGQGNASNSESGHSGNGSSSGAQNSGSSNGNEDNSTDCQGKRTGSECGSSGAGNEQAASGGNGSNGSGNEHNGSGSSSPHEDHGNGSSGQQGNGSHGNGQDESQSGSSGNEHSSSGTHGQSSEPEDQGNGCGCTTPPDATHGSACAEERRAWLDTYLTSLNVDHRVVTRAQDFQYELRSGRYTGYWLSGGEEKLDKAQAAELREAVNRGEGLLVDGAHDERNGFLDDLTGIKAVGKLPASAILSASWVDETGAGVQSPVLQPVQKLRPQGAAIRATLPGTRCTGQEEDEDKNEHGQTGASGHRSHGTGQSGASSECPAVVTFDYGQGHTQRYAYDLVATLRANPSTDLDAQLLGAIAAGVPASGDPIAGALATVSLTLANQGSAAKLHASLPLAGGFQLLESSPAASLGGTGLAWDFNLPENQSQTLDAWLLSPLQAGDYPLEAVVSADLGGSPFEYGRYPLSLHIADPIGGLPGLIAAMDATAAGGKDANRLKKAAAALRGAQSALDRQDEAGALEKLEDALDAVLDLQLADAPAWRLELDRIQKAAGIRWYNHTIQTLTP